MGSAIGYTVGLGDRHLDNILINPRYGYLIHVDFSILFGKGTSLKIPERVPFRLSQNLIAALQCPGVNVSILQLLPGDNSDFMYYNYYCEYFSP